MSLVFPIHGSFAFKRIDKGQDFLTKPGTPLVAVTSGTLKAGSDPGGFGPRYPILVGDDGHSYYYGHTDLSPSLIGKHVKAGDVIARTLSTPRGNATQPGWLEFGDAALLGKGGETGGGPIAMQLHAAAPKDRSFPGSVIHDVGNAASWLVQPPKLGSGPNTVDVGDLNPLPSASDIAGKVVGSLADALGIHASRILLYIVLVGGGVALAVAGLGRTAGVTSGDVRKAAKLGAVVA